jgi:acetoacetate decarboxylase
MSSFYTLPKSPRPTSAAIGICSQLDGPGSGREDEETELGRFKFEEDHRYMMPAHFGRMKYVTSTTTYRDVTNLVVQYRTERDAIEPYVPEALEITDPTLTVAFVMNRGVEWMAGGVQPGGCQRPRALRRRGRPCGGRLLPGRLGEQGGPIIAGREATGIPKIGATIEEARHLGGHWMAEAAYEGNTFLEMSLAKGMRFRRRRSRR